MQGTLTETVWGRRQCSETSDSEGTYVLFRVGTCSVYCTYASEASVCSSHPCCVLGCTMSSPKVSFFHTHIHTHTHTHTHTHAHTRTHTHTHIHTTPKTKTTEKTYSFVYYIIVCFCCLCKCLPLLNFQPHSCGEEVVCCFLPVFAT